MKVWTLIIPITTGLMLASCGPEPTPITIVETQEVEVTRQVVITATPDPPPTATSEPESVFEDDFEAGESEWLLEDAPESSVYLSDGRLVMEVNDEFETTGSSHPELQLLHDYVLEVDISYISGPTEAEAGIWFRCTGTDPGDEFITVAIDANGLFTVVRMVGEGGEAVVPWFLTSAIERGQVGTRLRLIDESRQVTVYINDQLVTTFPYDAAPSGCPFFFASTRGEGGAVWTFDNVTVREIGP